MFKQEFKEVYENSTAEGSIYGGQFIEKRYFLGIKYMEKTVTRTLSKSIQDSYPLSASPRMGFSRSE